jgi:hypothetical protein
MPRDPVIREKFTRERSAARKLVAEYFERFPKEQFKTEVESWCHLQSKHWPPPATLQSLPATPWYLAPILGGLNMQSRVFQRSQRLAIGQDHRPIEALIP